MKTSRWNVKRLKWNKPLAQDRSILHKYRYLAGLSIVALGLAFGGKVAHAETIDRIVAVVNNDIILYSELEEQVNLLLKVSPNLKLENQQQREEFDREVLRRMIRERLTEQEVKRLNITVSKHDIDVAVENFKKENGFTDDQLKYVLQQEGKTLEEFRENIKTQLERARLIERVLKSKTVVTEEQIDEYLQSHSAAGAAADAGRERRHLAVIFLPVGDKSKENEVGQLAEDIHKRLEKGDDFGRLAKEYSMGPAAQEGGDIGFIATDELAPVIESATRGLSANAFTEPMKTPQGYYIIKVVEIQREKQEVGNTAARDKARQVLFQQEVDQKYEQWIQELTEKSFIQINL